MLVLATSTPPNPILKTRQMEAIEGKVMLIIAWVFALISGQIISIVFSVIASCLAGTYWIIKIRKELKK